MTTKRGLCQLTIAGLLTATCMFVLLSPAYDQNANKPRHHFFLDGKGQKYDTKDVTTQVIVGDKVSEGRYTLLNDIWKVGFSVPTHYHATHCETFYLLSGQAEWTVNGETHLMKAGDAVYIPANAPHSTRQVGDKPAHFLLFYVAGDYEAHILREASYTQKQLEDPKIQEELRRLNDFNPVPKK